MHIVEITYSIEPLVLRNSGEVFTQPESTSVPGSVQ